MSADFTVTVAGPERHEGHAPFTYVVRADCIIQAIAWTLMVHAFNEDVWDVVPILGEEHTFAGRPGKGVRYHWIDTSGVTSDGG